jgi:UDP-GlcNAc:undecaprenyl-phosphate/decaprenyl-phosphate GlcNAc-1-phosphate transferase
MISDFTLILACLYAGLSALAICLAAPWIGKRLRLLDRPGGRKTHTKATPLMGGVALLVGLVPILFGYMLSYEPEGIGHWALTSFAVTIMGCALLGIFDDCFAIPARPRFIIAFLLFGALLLVEPRFSLRQLYFYGFDTPLILGPIGGWVFTVIVLLGFMNAVNMADGKNGLVMGLTIVWAALIVASGPVGLIPVLVPLIALMGVLLLFNLAGRLFLGDGGTYGLSAVIGLAATYSYNFQAGLMNADQLILLFLIPITDMMRLIAQRTLSGQSPMAADRNHLHHYLLNGFGWPGGLFVYLALVAIPNVIGTSRPELIPLLILASLVGYGVVVFALRPAPSASLTDPEG